MLGKSFLVKKAYMKCIIVFIVAITRAKPFIICYFSFNKHNNYLIEENKIGGIEMTFTKYFSVNSFVSGDNIVSTCALLLRHSF